MSGEHEDHDNENHEREPRIAAAERTGLPDDESGPRASAHPVLENSSPEPFADEDEAGGEPPTHHRSAPPPRPRLKDSKYPPPATTASAEADAGLPPPRKKVISSPELPAPRPRTTPPPEAGSDPDLGGVLAVPRAPTRPHDMLGDGAARPPVVSPPRQRMATLREESDDDDITPPPRAGSDESVILPPAAKAVAVPSAKVIEPPSARSIEPASPPAPRVIAPPAATAPATPPSTPPSRVLSPPPKPERREEYVATYSRAPSLKPPPLPPNVERAGAPSSGTGAAVAPPSAASPPAAPVAASPVAASPVVAPPVAPPPIAAPAVAASPVAASPVAAPPVVAPPVVAPPVVAPPVVAPPVVAPPIAAPPVAASPVVAPPVAAPPVAAPPVAAPPVTASPAAGLPAPPVASTPAMTPPPPAIRPGSAGAATSYPPASSPPPPVKSDSIAVHAIRVINIGVDDTSLPPPPPPPLARSDGDDFENIEDYTEEEFEPPPDSLDEADVQALTEDEPALPKPPAVPAEAAPPASLSAPSTDVKLPPPPKRQAPSPPKKKGPRAPAKKRKPWWEEVFSEDFARATHHLSNRHIRREVDFIDHSLGVAQGAVVLDLACGTGEHSIELASRGYSVVGYDLSVYQLAIAGETAQERELKINFLQGDMREMAFQEMFDGIFCWNTSFGYFEEEKNVAVAERIFHALRPGGMFLIDVVNRDHVMQHQPSQVWFQGDACVCMDDMSVDYITSRLRVKRSIIMDDGRTRECFYSIRLYTLHELGKLLHAVGFRVVEASGHPTTPGVYLGPNSPRVIILAQRP